MIRAAPTGEHGHGKHCGDGENDDGRQVDELELAFGAGADRSRQERGTARRVVAAVCRVAQAQIPAATLTRVSRRR